MHEISDLGGNVICVRVQGKLTGSDYDELIPACEREIEQHGSMRMLLVMEDFHGWDPGGAWDDFHFSLEHRKEVERVAMVGEKKWQQWLAKIGSWFMPERVRYFDLADLAEAERWVGAD